MSKNLYKVKMLFSTIPKYMMFVLLLKAENLSKTEYLSSCIRFFDRLIFLQWKGAEYCIHKNGCWYDCDSDISRLKGY